MWQIDVVIETVLDRRSRSKRASGQIRRIAVANAGTGVAKGFDFSHSRGIELASKGSSLHQSGIPSSGVNSGMPLLIG
jgi:hypothetical protein